MELVNKIFNSGVLWSRRNEYKTDWWNFVHIVRDRDLLPISSILHERFKFHHESLRRLRICGSTNFSDEMIEAIAPRLQVLTWEDASIDGEKPIQQIIQKLSDKIERISLRLLGEPDRRKSEGDILGARLIEFFMSPRAKNLKHIEFLVDDVNATMALKCLADGPACGLTTFRVQVHRENHNISLKEARKTLRQVSLKNAATLSVFDTTGLTETTEPPPLDSDWKTFDATYRDQTGLGLNVVREGGRSLWLVTAEHWSNKDNGGVNLDQLDELFKLCKSDADQGLDELAVLVPNLDHSCAYCVNKLNDAMKFVSETKIRLGDRALRLIELLEPKVDVDPSELRGTLLACLDRLISLDPRRADLVTNRTLLEELKKKNETN
jgi:hypothetical protein